MASTNFKIFDENKTNIMPDGQYSTNQQRINGVQTGVASSQLNNKFAYQVSLIAYALAQMMVANGLNANDSDAVTTFVNNLSSSILQKVVDKASEEVALAGIDDTKWMSALQVANALENFGTEISNNFLNVKLEQEKTFSGTTTSSLSSVRIYNFSGSIPIKKIAGILIIMEGTYTNGDLYATPSIKILNNTINNTTINANDTQEFSLSLFLPIVRVQTGYGTWMAFSDIGNSTFNILSSVDKQNYNTGINMNFENGSTCSVSGNIKVYSVSM